MGVAVLQQNFIYGHKFELHIIFTHYKILWFVSNHLKKVEAVFRLQTGGFADIRELSHPASFKDVELAHF